MSEQTLVNSTDTSRLYTEAEARAIAVEVFEDMLGQVVASIREDTRKALPRIGEAVMHRLIADIPSNESPDYTAREAAAMLGATKSDGEPTERGYRIIKQIGRKDGSQWRVTREALDEYRNGCGTP